jgi:hypothetical protein
MWLLAPDPDAKAADGVKALAIGLGLTLVLMAVVWWIRRR